MLGVDDVSLGLNSLMGFFGFSCKRKIQKRGREKTSEFGEVVGGNEKEMVRWKVIFNSIAPNASNPILTHFTHTHKFHLIPHHPI